MKDYLFGNRLYALRREAGLSQAELGARLRVSNKAVSKWENGTAKPGLDIARRLAEALNVTLDELMTPLAPEKRITTIVITGGPCAGKTTAMSWIQNAFRKMGYAVLFVDETAAQLISGGAAPWLCASGREFQLELLRLQLAKEAAFTAIARNMKADRVLIVCDRGAMDNRAYMSDEEFRWVLRMLGIGEVALRDQYDAVIHLVTAAKGALKYYQNSEVRREPPEKAAELDDRLIAAWTGHPHFRIIDNSTDFEDKMRRLIREISIVLGEPAPLEIERKFLIRRPDPKALAQRPNCRRVDIVQTYLLPEEGAEEVRIRQRGAGGSYVYYHTRKRKLMGMRRVEEEERLTERQYLTLLTRADPACRTIRKQRYCLSENGLYYEIDLYPEWKDQAIMEIELHSEDQAIVFPEGIEVIREVTGEEAFTNHALARIR